MSDRGAFWEAAASPGDAESVGDTRVVFTRRARAIEARHRVPYRTGLLVMVLAGFNRRTASIASLHAIMWATRNRRTGRMFMSWWNGRRFLATSTQRFDPDLGTTIRLAIADSLVEPTKDGARIRLTDRGQSMAAAIIQEEGILRSEKDLLAWLGPLSDASVKRRLEGE